MSGGAEGRKVLEMLRLDGFAVTPPEIFDTIAAKVETVRQFG
jgi:phosphonate transport system substrate-binding protein